MAYQNHLPSIDPETEPFWQAAREHRLLIQRCEEDGTFIFYPRAVCPTCMSDQLTWTEASGKGTVYSYTIVHHSPHPAFQEEAPYIVALIELNEGVRMMSTVKTSLDQIRIGMHVQVVFDDGIEGVTLPQFRPI